MWLILVSLFVGIFIGYFFNLNDKHKSYNSRIQQIGVIFLLFCMGISAGGNKAIIRNLKNIGKISLTFALLTSLFSIILVFFVTSYFMKERD
ncbi:LysO family transporter [Clostridium thailandense]|uniref:LysO family transporter n=1 Tax=Clostridium thailandense TaxID=2794346 RepID=A0A949TQI4_9CLOT|nr:LysO family transporter [Clostridium thailandense]MBV7276690.1 LysO family transporter [Clostridium thailandense]MCH5135646.1 LysO family transporter [Clostridiaceae bacterium UIB06]